MKRDRSSAVRGRSRHDFITIPKQMAVTFWGENATRSVVLVHETRTNKEGFRDTREGLCRYSQR